MSLKQLGRYEIIGTLGRGSMGVVYQAHDPLIERTVAIKTVSYAGLAPEEAEEFEKRFFLEAKSAGRLNHPNIVTIHDVGRADDLAYIAMEFLSGQSLRSVLDSGVVLPVRRIVKIAAQVADGLAFAHAHGVVHRDIKPANIMVLDTNIVKISDFGIALLPCGSLTMDGRAVGSPRYMSPEQVLGKKADGRSDIFSLGAVLYEMLVGHPPFTGTDLNAILYQVLNGAPPLPSTLNPGFPPGLDRIVARALSKDPDKRYQNAAEMAADLRNYRQTPGLLQSAEKTQGAPAVSTSDVGKPIMPAAMPATFPTEKRARASRYGLIIGVLALLVGVGGYLGWLQAQPQATVAAAADPVAPVRAGVEVPGAVAPQGGESPPQGAETQAADTPRSVAAPAKASGLEKKAARRKDPEAKRAQKDSTEIIALQAEEPAPSATEKRLPENDWKTLLRAELAACQSESFFSRLMCNETARWKYCPGRWGSIEECTKGENPSR